MGGKGEKVAQHGKKILAVLGKDRLAPIELEGLAERADLGVGPGASAQKEHQRKKALQKKVRQE